MRHWSQIATRNWRAKRVRTAGALLAIALGTGAVVWVTCCYESVSQAMLSWAGGYIGHSHITIQSPLGKYDTLPQRIVAKIAAIEGVQHVAAALVVRLPSAAATRDPYVTQIIRGPTMPDVDFHGIDLEQEFHVRDWPDRLVAGRMLSAPDERVCVLEQSIAEEQHVGVGDKLLVWGTGAAEDAPTELEIVGLIRRERIARFQKGVALLRLPVLQQIAQKQALVNEIDVVVDHPGGGRLEHVQQQIQIAVRVDAPKVLVRSAAARMERIRLAQQQEQVVLVLLSCVALLTALFIILSTLSMGMIERIAQLGLLRCIGMKRSQLAVLVLAEVLPLGLVGVLLGVPVGLGLTRLTVWLVPKYVGAFLVSRWGILLACGAGLLTTVVAALLPAAAALTVSPLEATRPRARRGGFDLLVLALVWAVAVLVAQHGVMTFFVQRDLLFVRWSAAAVVLLYLVYALAAAPAVWLVSRFAVPVTAALVRVRSRLLQDQVGHAVWRSAGICCGLMVGLSLIVGLLVFNASFRSGWQFPKQFPEAYVWSDDQIAGDIAGTVAQVPGVKTFTVANAPNVIVEERPLLIPERVLRSVTWFLGIDPDSFLDMVQLEFIEGDKETARELLRKGGYVLVAADFARTRHKGVKEQRDAAGNVVVSNKVRVWFNDHWSVFTVAGVIDSPALDIAASYFQVQSESYMAAVGSVIGTNSDLKKLWGVDGARLILLNYDLPPEPPPAGWPPPPGTREAVGLSHMHYNGELPLERRWQNYRETCVLREILQRLHASARYGTARELKDEIDAELTKLTYLLSAVPGVALLVAALGVANLMTANVASRTKQLATLRAVGATRGQVLRLVIGEALVLGLLGSGLGLGLGMHLAWNVTTMTERMWGYHLAFHVPWPFVGLAIALTVGLCVLAGIAPARHAARTNVIEALRVA